MSLLPLAQIRTDGGTQPRAAIDSAAVHDYMIAMQGGIKFPPVVVFYDGSEYWLADGFHRNGAAFEAGLAVIDCDVHQGTREDAQWYSFSANKANGIRRKNEDKQRAVRAALLHPLGVDKSDFVIANHVGVDQKTVTNWRRQLEVTQEIPESNMRTGADGRTINTDRIGHTALNPVKSEPEPYRGGTRVSVSVPRSSPEPIRPAACPTPARPELSLGEEVEAATLLRAIAALGSHQMSAADLIAAVPPQNMPVMRQKALAAYEFLSFFYEGAVKRAEGVA